MKKVFLLSLLSLALFAACRQETKPQLFERLAKEQTKTCPVQIDSFIRLDSVAYLPADNVSKYYYTLSGEFDDLDYIRENTDELQRNITDGVINSVDLMAYKEYNTTFEYIYHSQNSKALILTIRVLPEDYK